MAHPVALSITIQVSCNSASQINKMEGLPCLRLQGIADFVWKRQVTPGTKLHVIRTLFCGDLSLPITDCVLTRKVQSVYASAVNWEEPVRVMYFVSPVLVHVSNEKFVLTQLTCVA